MATATTIGTNPTATVNALMTLIRPLSIDIKTALIERLQRLVKREEKKVDKDKLFRELCGAWADDGLTADEEVEMIYSARQDDVTRKIEPL